MKTWWRCLAVGLVVLLMSPLVNGRPIVFARSTTAMAEYRQDAMAEAQVFYAPRHNWSVGLGYFQVEGDDITARHSFGYVRANLLAKRWNLENAQANIFLWGGVGRAYVGETFVDPANPDDSGHNHGAPPSPTAIPVPSVDAFAWTSGGQIDYETRRVYTSYKLDLHRSDILTHRADTLQFGIAPYEHDVNSLAIWLIVSGRRYSGNMHESYEELAVLARFFRKRAWFEVGGTMDGKLQALAMFSF